MQTKTALTDLHVAAGARLSPCFGVELPEQFTDFSAEYSHAREHAALIDTNFRAIFSLAGPDRTRYLNAVLTSNIRDLAPGQGAIGLLLNSQGHIQAELETFALEDRILIFGHAFLREQTFATLDKFIIMDDATLTDETDASGTLAIEGPAAPAIARQLAGLDLEALAPHAHIAANIQTEAGTIPCRLIRHSLFGFSGAEFLASSDALAPLWHTLSKAVHAHGGAAIGCLAFNTLRLEAGIPWFGLDFDERQIPHEAALETTHISYTKGCYTGQEIVERVRSRGHANRRRTGLSFSGATPPAPGAPLTVASTTATGEAAQTEVGYVTSAAFSPRANQLIGMGYVRREHAQPATVLHCGETEARIIQLPLSSA